MLTTRAIEIGQYVKAPRCWDSYKVPWGLSSECPRAVLLWGIRLAACPFHAADTSREPGSVAHALWAAVLIQWAQNVAAELLAEAESAWNGDEAGDLGRLWWIPPALIGGMKDIGARALCGAIRC